VTVAAIDRKAGVMADEQTRERAADEVEDLELEEVDAESVRGGGGGVPGGPKLKGDAGLRPLPG
jgi:hypothetical protein